MAVMNHEMRRSKQAIDRQECWAVLERGTSGVLALCGEEGQPYAVPLSYAILDGSLVFHSALTGLKLDLVRQSGKASFCVIDRDDVVPERFTTNYRSVIAFGDIEVVEDEDCRLAAFHALGERYWPGHEEDTMQTIASSGKRSAIIRLSVDALTGKEGAFLAKQRREGASSENQR